jgi:hypothetical protein
MTGVWLFLVQAGVLAGLGAVAVLLGGRVVLTVFHLAESSRARELPPGATAIPEVIAPLTAAAATLRGGAWIGMLERLAAFATIVGGFPEGLAFALLLKGFARYPELRATTTGAAERFIIGTFASVLFACACAGVARWLIDLL